MEETRPSQTTLEQQLHGPIIKVMGLGGGGSNAVDRMIELGIPGVQFIAANTDYQVLQTSQAPVKIQLGPQLTRGLGAGGDQNVGFQAAQESRAAIEEALRGADMVFLTAGMGGGTGTGAIAVAGEVARSLGAVTIAVVTTPFSFEMGRRQKSAQEGMTRLRPHTDTLIAIPNDRLLFVAPQDLPLETAFRLADDVLRQAVQGIAELITQPGLINVDFSHVRSMMKRGGGALMAIGHGTGENKVIEAINQALEHPLLESISLADAQGIIANFSGGDDLSLYEVGEAIGHIHKLTGDDVDVIMGLSQDDRMRQRAQVILVVTGLGAKSLAEVLPGAEAIHSRPSLSEDMVEAEVVAESEPIPMAQEEESYQAVPVDILNDLDVPAFLRKRARVSAHVAD